MIQRITVSKRMPVTYTDFLMDLHLDLVERHSLSSVEANLLLEDKQIVIKREFKNLVMIIELSQVGYRDKVQNLTTKLLK